MNETYLIHIPKAAGTSIMVSVPKPYVYFCHMYGCYYPKRIRHKLRTIVRNPYDRLVSAYHFMVKGGFNQNRVYLVIRNNYSNFEDFVLNGLNETMCHHSFHHDIHPLEPLFLQTDFILDEYGNFVLSPKHIGRYETLAEDCKRLFNIDHLSHHNWTQHRDWRSYYTNSLVRDKVRDIYRQDFELLGYSTTIDHV